MKLTFYKNRQALVNSDIVKHMQLSREVKELYASFTYDDRTRVLTMQLSERPKRTSIKLHGQGTSTGKIYNFVFCPTDAFKAIGLNAESLIGERIIMKAKSKKWEYTGVVPELDDLSKHATVRRRIKEIMRKLGAIDRQYLALYLTPEAGYDD